MENKEIIVSEDKVNKAIRKFISLKFDKYYEFNGHFIGIENDEWTDEGVVVLIDASYTTNKSFDHDVMSHKEFEMIMYEFLAEHHEIGNMMLRYDTCQMIIIHEDRGFIRYRVNDDLKD